MIIEYIERLRKEPPEVRRRAVGFWTVIIVVLILLIYMGVTALRVTKSFTPSTNTLAAPYESSVNQ